MEVIHERDAYRAACEAARRNGRDVGFVPTMGALHDGHRALMRQARDESAFVAASIFVNPLQFGEGEDFDAYPRALDRDAAVCDQEAVDAVFAPSPGEMYPNGEPTVTVDPGPAGDTLEGATRPGHFRGVCTVVAKLLGLTGPCDAYFGEKDAQQLFVVRKMVADLDMPVRVIGVATVREPDGLAMSSRNAFLSPEERAAAACLSRGLRRAVRLSVDGATDAAALRRAMIEEIDAEPLATLDYATVVDEATFDQIETIEPPARWVGHVRSGEPPHLQARMTKFFPTARAVVAAWVGATRLIDNMALVPPMAENP